MIEGRVRGLVAEVAAASDGWTARERIDAIAELEAAVAMLQAVSNVEAVAYVEQRRTADKTARADTGIAGRGAPVEIAMARGVSRATVDYQLGFARQLVDDHPALLAACLDGQVGQSAAKHIVQATEPLTPQQRRAIDGELAELACELTPGEVCKAAGRKVAATDPHAAEKRAAAARARTAVRAFMHGDGTGSLTALLPAEQALAAWQTLDHEARCRRADGADRAIDRLMGDLLVERVTGQATATDLNLEVGVVVAASSLLGVDDQPAKLVGHRGGDHGILPAGLARRLADSDSAWVRRLVCDPADGRLLSMDPTRRRFDGARRRFVIYRDGTSRRPYSSTPIYDIDHTHRYADGGLTVAANAQGLGKTDHTLHDLPGWSVASNDGDAGDEIRWITPTGHAYHSRPPPILGRGNTREPPTRPRHGPRRIVIDHYRSPLPLEYASGHHRRPDAA